MKGFRVWCKSIGKYIDFGMMISQDGKLLYMDVGHEFQEVPSENCIDYIVEYPTGLKDKNGKEIYEGDIVKLGEDIYEVLFDSYGQFCIENKKLHWTKDSFSFNSVDVWDSKRDELLVKVVGNIHMNPELLEEEA